MNNNNAGLGIKTKMKKMMMMMMKTACNRNIQEYQMRVGGLPRVIIIKKKLKTNFHYLK